MPEKKVILVIDDDNASSYICSRFLGEQYTILNTSTGKEAVRIVEEKKIDLILLDIAMPVMDGFTVYDEIRKSMKGIQIPIIFITGMLNRKTVLACKSKGADGVIAKPLRKEVLTEKISAILKYKSKVEKHKKILVIDDDVNFLRIMKIYLRERYDVMAISTTRTAIEYLRTHTPDLILLDYYMPLYNGADIMRVAKKGNMARGTKFVLISGSMDVNMLNECITLGLDGAISKTAAKDEILAKLQKILEG